MVPLLARDVLSFERCIVGELISYILREPRR